eukprot:CAMPEP_0173385410 /NCGR_PEP_ID=MMETSP1356-20130122/8017_1 /TAXON_ID=77927 ORGANISM="Hemiselmis virescens, Strain PCC157" /NCGR_SAMPLE_ID=MMETSP1356 /ASSEMBLY_ACC=CAM_ASM_000847 /LENGTH=131 /DNA_ID=CAMNT_0014341195 /DNA_START=23 /DNA_END=418 /DNA_ORIENTATION=-
MRSSLVLCVLAALAAVSQAFSVGSGFAAVRSFTGALAESSSSPSTRGGLTGLQMAHHVNNKGAKKARKNRPRKSCLSDINRKAPTYSVDTMAASRQKIPEFSKIGEADMSSYFKIEKECGKVFYHTKAPHA